MTRRLEGRFGLKSISALPVSTPSNRTIKVVILLYATLGVPFGLTRAAVTSKIGGMSKWVGLLENVPRGALFAHSVRLTASRKNSWDARLFLLHSQPINHAMKEVSRSEV